MLVQPNWSETGGARFVTRGAHRDWLMAQAVAMLDLFQNAMVNPNGGFFGLDNAGHPLPAPQAQAGVTRHLHETARMVHCFAIAHLLGRPGADAVIDHGMDFLWMRHRDAINGGYFWGVDDRGPTDPLKQAYGHAFVLLAGASAKVAGHPDADRLIADVAAVLRTRFWDADAGAAREEFSADWQPISTYRGQNANMHLTEALMAAFEATGEAEFLGMAHSIARLIIGRHARAQGWRVAEHFDGNWQVDRDFAGDPMFRPHGTTPGHALEWSRLLIQLWQLGGRRVDWLPDAAKRLFLTAVDHGWDHDTGGFYYTLGWDNQAECADRFWWPCAEGIGAAAVLASINDDPRFEAWYRRIWGFVDAHMIDHVHGGWFAELDSALRPVARVFTGKPDLYHALQACLIPLMPLAGSITRNLADPLNRPAPSTGDAV